MAAPQFAGDTALLLSAAKADGVEAPPTALRTALTGTAVQIPGVPTTAQGTGLVDVAAAWTQLSKGVQVNDYAVSAPVCSSLSAHLATPNTGAGVYNRCLPGKGGQVVGADKTYQVSVTRKTGPSGSALHQIGWIGNDGTFSARDALPLRLGSRGMVAITANASSAGVHSAIMTIDDPATVGVDRFVPVTVMATQALTAPDHRVTHNGTLARAGSMSFLVPVPEGVEALQLELGGLADGSQVRVLPIDPDGMPADSTASNHCYTGYPDPAGCEATERAVQRPKAGVWEFVVEARRTSATADNPFTAQVSLQGMSFAPEDTTIDSAGLHKPVSADFSGTNTWGALKAHAIDGELGFVRNLFSTVANGELTANRVDVPRQSTRMDLTLTPRAKDADLDMYVVGFRGIAATSMNIGNGAERIVLDDPLPGTYYVVVTGANVPSGPATFDYHEEVFSQGIGTIAPKSDEEHALQPGAAMPVAADISLSQVPLTSEPVIGRVRVANAFGTIVGAANVRISQVVAPKLEVKKWEKPFVGAKLTNSGVVAGDRQFNSRTVPTTWTESGGFKDLDKGAAQSGSALDMNEGLATVGYLSYSGQTRPAMWSADGTVTDLGLPEWRPRPYASGFATGIDEQGTVVGFAEVQYRDETGGHTYVDPFTWTAAGGFTKLDHLSDNTTQTQARAISPSGLVVGTSLTAGGAPRAVTWDKGTGQLTNLGTLPGQGDSVALGVNAGGTVVGVSGDDAFVWTPAGMQRLPDFGFNAVAEKVTSDGWILGSVELRPDLAVTAMWDPQGRIWDLSAMTPGDVWFNPTYAFGINDAHDLMIYGEGGPAGASSSTALLHIPDEMMAD
jgi:probable HAF family extracellular repeat protein